MRPSCQCFKFLDVAMHGGGLADMGELAHGAIEVVLIKLDKKKFAEVLSSLGSTLQFFAIATTLTPPHSS